MSETERNELDIPCGLCGHGVSEHHWDVGCQYGDIDAGDCQCMYTKGDLFRAKIAALEAENEQIRKKGRVHEMLATASVLAVSDTIERDPELSRLLDENNRLGKENEQLRAAAAGWATSFVALHAVICPDVEFDPAQREAVTDAVVRRATRLSAAEEREAKLREALEDAFVTCPVCCGEGVVVDGDDEEDTCPNVCTSRYVVPATSAIEEGGDNGG